MVRAVLLEVLWKVSSRMARWSLVSEQPRPVHHVAGHRLRLLAHYRAGGQIRGGLLVLRRADGTSAWVEVTRRSVHDETGRLPGDRMILVDVTERELGCRLGREPWSFTGERVSLHFERESRDVDGRWWRSDGDERWEFAEQRRLT